MKVVSASDTFVAIKDNQKNYQLANEAPPLIAFTFHFTSLSLLKRHNRKVRDFQVTQTVPFLVARICLYPTNRVMLFGIKHGNESLDELLYNIELAHLIQCIHT